MCYAIPGKVIEIKDNIAVVDYFGEHRNVLNEFKNVTTGDYVYAQGGYIVHKIPGNDAKKILDTWKDAFFRLQRVDAEISKVKSKITHVGSEFAKIIEKARLGGSIGEDEILQMLKTEDEGELDLLYTTANVLRQKNLKNSCCVHGIIEFSNHCRNNCAYCGIRKGNKNLLRYRMNVDEIVDAAIYATNVHGFKALVLQSGEDPWYTAEKLAEVIENIKEKCGVLLFMSVGGRDLDCYEGMYKAGARGILLRFETSNPKLYGKIHSGPKSSFGERIKLLKHASKLGYIIATGSLIGLPGQTEKDLMNDILLTKSLGAEMYSFGPLISHPETPLADTPIASTDRVLKVIAASRLVDPDAKILVTTALETLDKDGARRGLLAGANSLMINVTPQRFGQHYSIYPDHSDLGKTADKINETLELLYSLGRAPTDLGVRASA